MLNEAMPIIATVLYGKNEQADLSQDERRGALAIVTTMKAAMAART